MPIIMGIGENTTFGFYIDNYLSLAKTFKDMHEFLHKTYFLQVAFGSVYLTRKETFAFNNRFNILGFKKTAEKLKPAIKYQDKIKN